MAFDSRNIRNSYRGPDRDASVNWTVDPRKRLAELYQKIDKSIKKIRSLQQERKEIQTLIRHRRYQGLSVAEGQRNALRIVGQIIAERDTLENLRRGVRKERPRVQSLLQETWLARFDYQKYRALRYVTQPSTPFSDRKGNPISMGEVSRLYVQAFGKDVEAKANELDQATSPVYQASGYGKVYGFDQEGPQIEQAVPRGSARKSLYFESTYNPDGSLITDSQRKREFINQLTADGKNQLKAWGVPGFFADVGVDLVLIPFHQAADLYTVGDYTEKPEIWRGALFNTLVGFAGTKVGQSALKPIMRRAGQYLGKLTPYLEKMAGKNAGPIKQKILELIGQKEKLEKFLTTEIKIPHDKVKEIVEGISTELNGGKGELRRYQAEFIEKHVGVLPAGLRTRFIAGYVIRSEERKIAQLWKEAAFRWAKGQGNTPAQLEAIISRNVAQAKTHYEKPMQGAFKVQTDPGPKRQVSLAPISYPPTSRRVDSSAPSQVSGAKVFAQVKAQTDQPSPKLLRADPEVSEALNDRKILTIGGMGVDHAASGRVQLYDRNVMLHGPDIGREASNYGETPFAISTSTPGMATKLLKAGENEHQYNLLIRNSDESLLSSMNTTHVIAQAFESAISNNPRLRKLLLNDFNNIISKFTGRRFDTFREGWMAMNELSMPLRQKINRAFLNSEYEYLPNYDAVLNELTNPELRDVEPGSVIGLIKTNARESALENREFLSDKNDILHFGDGDVYRPMSPYRMLVPGEFIGFTKPARIRDLVYDHWYRSYYLKHARRLKVDLPENFDFFDEDLLSHKRVESFLRFYLNFRGGRIELDPEKLHWLGFRSKEGDMGRLMGVGIRDV